MSYTLSNLYYQNDIDLFFIKTEIETKNVQ